MRHCCRFGIVTVYRLPHLFTRYQPASPVPAVLIFRRSKEVLFLHFTFLGLLNRAVALPLQGLAGRWPHIFMRDFSLAGGAA